MSKEWLEDWLKDKKEQLKSATVFINKNGNEAVEVSLSVLNKLFEQAERVQELEEEIEDWRKEVEKWQRFFREESQKNKRYREAIEVAIHNMAASDNLGVKFALGILEQALESEK